MNVVQQDAGQFSLCAFQIASPRFIDMFGEDLDFLSQLEIYNIYYEIEQ